MQTYILPSSQEVLLNNLKWFSQNLCLRYHFKELRQNGKRVTDDHAIPVGINASKIVTHPVWSFIAQASGFLHDIPEKEKFHLIKDKTIRYEVIDAFNNQFTNSFGGYGYYLIKVVDALTSKCSTTGVTELRSLTHKSNFRSLNISTGICSLAVKTEDIASNNKDPQEKPVKLETEISFYGKKTRKSFEFLEFTYPTFKSIFEKHKNEKRGGILLYNHNQAIKSLNQTKQSVLEFLKTHPIQDIIHQNNGIGNLNGDLVFYLKALKNISAQHLELGIENIEKLENIIIKNQQQLTNPNLSLTYH